MDRLNISPEDLRAFSNYQKPDVSFIYELSQELNDAVQVAIALDQPLLITGEPGTGKTLLAEKVAADLHRITNGQYRNAPYEFHTKSNSIYSDLFYTYDAVSHFYDANIKKEARPEIKNYIDLNALGSAIAGTLNSEERAKIPARNLPPFGEPTNSVVLIDEIDKAPRDFPNDILNELEHYSFRIKEAGIMPLTKSHLSHIFIILTSNGEKDFPEAFLRRCIYFKIDFPENDLLLTILEKHGLERALKGKSKIILDRFSEIRTLCRTKKPSTAELIAWCRVLVQWNVDVSNVTSLAKTLPVVVKNSEDMASIRNHWFSAPDNSEI